jgi:hypothetical protein
MPCPSRDISLDRNKILKRAMEYIVHSKAYVKQTELRAGYNGGLSRT